MDENAVSFRERNLNYSHFGDWIPLQSLPSGGDLQRAAFAVSFREGNFQFFHPPGEMSGLGVGEVRNSAVPCSWGMGTPKPET